MSDFFSTETPPKRVLIIKLRHYGDVLLISPLFTVLKKNWPAVEADALVYDDTQDMLTRHPYINQIHTIGRNWRKRNLFSQFRLYHALLKTLKSRDYDVLINLTEHWHGVRLARHLNPRISVGLKLNKREGLSRLLWAKSFTTLYPAIQDNTRHMVEVNLDALRHIGIHPKCAKDKQMLFVASEEAELSISEKLEALGIRNKSYILVHPTSRWMFKAVNIEQLASAINHLASRGLPIVLSAAPSKAEISYIKALRAALTQPVYDLSGQLNLKELGVLIKRARVYFGVDSMPTHLASAVGTPTVVVFGPTGAIKWAPWRVKHRIIMADFTCQPCGKAGCGDSGISDCMIAISSQQMLSAIDTILLETPDETETSDCQTDLQP